jgi:hypothetical protein
MPTSQRSLVIGFRREDAPIQTEKIWAEMINFTDVKFEGHLIRQYATGKTFCSVLQNCLLFHYAKADMRKRLPVGG